MPSKRVGQVERHPARQSQRHPYPPDRHTADRRGRRQERRGREEEGRGDHEPQPRILRPAEYSIGDGQEDGYLAACEVIRRTVDLDKKEITRADIVERSAVDAFTGRKVKPGEIENKYTASDYDAKLKLDDRGNGSIGSALMFVLFINSSIFQEEVHR
jgi:hypothetical protein